MKKIFIFVLTSVFIFNLFVTLQSLEMILDPMAQQIDRAEQAYERALNNFERNRINIDQFKVEINAIFEQFYGIISSPEVQEQYVRDRAFELIIKIQKKIERYSLLTEPVIERYLEFIENSIIPQNSLQTSKSSLTISLDKLITHYIQINALENGLKVIKMVKALQEKSPISEAHLKRAYNKQVSIAELFMNGKGVAKDLNKAQRLFLEVINYDSPAELDAIKRSLNGILEIIFEKNNQETSEEELDALNDILDNIALGTFKSTAKYAEKARLYQVDLAIHYSSPAINNIPKAREILDGIINSDATSPKTRKSARDLLKTL
jgi:hypothetical protein